MDDGVLSRFLAQPGGVCILDGGFGTALGGGEAQKDVLWGTQQIMTPAGREDVKAVHRRFVLAGAEVLGTCSYKLSRQMLEQHRFWTDPHPCAPAGLKTREQQSEYVEQLLRDSVSICRQVIDEHAPAGRPKPLVAAAVGPASEVFPFNGVTDTSSSLPGGEAGRALFCEYYREKLPPLAGADIIALETLPGLAEAEIALDALEELVPGAKCWVSFICREPACTIDGSDLAECVRRVERRASVLAVGVNCIAPELAVPLVELVASQTSKPVLVYPNSGEHWDASQGKREWHVCAGDDGHHHPLRVLDGSDALAYRRAGASLIGGCCRVNDGQIRQFRAALKPERRELPAQRWGDRFLLPSALRGRL